MTCRRITTRLASLAALASSQALQLSGNALLASQVALDWVRRHALGLPVLDSYRPRARP